MKRNHRRKNRKKSYGEVREVTYFFPRKRDVNYIGAQEITEDQVFYRSHETEVPLDNGYLKSSRGKAHLDKSMQGWRGRAPLADRDVEASIGNDFSNGNRGMAKAVKGAKKFVRSRIRFHENQATRRLAQEIDIEE